MNFDDKMLLDLNAEVQQYSDRIDYHMEHIKLARRYAIIINNRIGYNLDTKKLSYVSLAHDLFKERGLNKAPEFYKFPKDLNRYVRENLDILEIYNLDDYFNSCASYHALSSGIYLHKELGIRDPELLYPIMFHSCPIIDIYETLPFKTKMMIDVLILADKLSSNYLRINMMNKEVRLDLDKVVFGSSGREFNYSFGLYLAILVSQGKTDNEESKKVIEYYFKRLSDDNPLISKIPNIKNLKQIGDNKIWEKRKSQALMIR